jgi:type IV secretion system protein VirB5
MSTSRRRMVFSCMVCLASVSSVRAQFAVIDVASVTQLMTEVQTLQQQLATARDDLAQAQAAYQSTIGGRGMERLLSGTVRNYLPADWSGLQATFQGVGGGYPAFATDLAGVLTRNTVLSPQQLAAVSPSMSEQLQSDRQTVALSQAVSHAALANTSMRFASLQQLIDAIARAGDQKATLELDARIGAEVGMLQNEQTKLQVLHQSMQAEQWANALRARERVVAGHGQFASRFRPTPRQQ